MRSHVSQLQVQRQVSTYLRVHVRVHVSVLTMMTVLPMIPANATAMTMNPP